jgi:hypothetical protein
MPFDSTYVDGTLIAIPRGFLSAGSLTFSPDSRDDTRNLGVRETEQLIQAIGLMDSRVTDFGISRRANGFATTTVVTGKARSATGTVNITEKEMSGDEVSRPRSYISANGVSKKTTASSGTQVNIWTPSPAMLGSLAVIVDSTGLSKARNYAFNLIRVENAGGAPITAGQAVAFSSVGTGSMPKVAPTNGDVAPQDFAGILAEDIGVGEVGACYSAAGGGAAFVPAAVGAASGAVTVQIPAVLSVAGSPGGYDPVGGAASQQIGVWKHIGSPNTAYILQLGTTV